MPRPTAEKLREQRSKEMDRPKGRLASSFSARLVGCSYASDYPRTLNVLEELEAEAYEQHNNAALEGRTTQKYPEPIWLELVRNPDNEHDPNAVSVCFEGRHIGHIVAPLARRLAPELDADPGSWTCELEHVYRHPNNPEHPGCSVLLKRVADA